MKKEENIVILFAIGLEKQGIVIAHNSKLVERDIENIGNDVNHIWLLGRSELSQIGIYVWEGSAIHKYKETKYIGDYRPISHEMLSTYLSLCVRQ